MDTFRHLHPGRSGHSLVELPGRSQSKNIGWRIDYVLVSKGFEGR